MNKKLLGIIIILSLIIIAGCSQNSINAKIIEDNKEIIKIGAILPLTGKGYYIGEELRNGLIFASEDINRNSEITNKKIKLIIEDDNTDPVKAISAMHKLIGINKASIILTAMSSVSESLSPIAEENKIILFGATTIDRLAEDNKYVFKDHASIYSDCKFIAQNINKNKKIAMVGGNQESTIDCIKGFKDSGINISEELFNKGEIDFRSYLLKVRDSDYIALRAYKEDLIKIVKQSIELGIDVKFICPQIKDGCNSEELKKIAKEQFEGSIGTDSYLETNSQFIERYKQRFGNEPTSDAIYMYDDLNIIFKAINSCNYEDISCIKDKILETKHQGVAGVVEFNEYGIARRRIQFLEFNNGKFVAVT